MSEDEHGKNINVRINRALEHEINLLCEQSGKGRRANNKRISDTVRMLLWLGLRLYYMGNNAKYAELGLLMQGKEIDREYDIDEDNIHIAGL